MCANSDPDHTENDPSFPMPLGEAMIPLVYERAREIANRTLTGDRAERWLRASSLVHMAFIRVMEDGGLSTSTPKIDEARLLAVLTTIMRRTVVDVVRAATARKRREDLRISLHTDDIAEAKRAIDVVEIDDAMRALAEICDESARVAELRLWGGMEFEQIAEATGMPFSRVRARWNRAKAYLAKDLVGRSGGGDTTETPS